MFSPPSHVSPNTVEPTQPGASPQSHCTASHRRSLFLASTSFSFCSGIKRQGSDTTAGQAVSVLQGYLHHTPAQTLRANKAAADQTDHAGLWFDSFHMYGWKLLSLLSNLPSKDFCCYVPGSFQCASNNAVCRAN